MSSVFEGVSLLRNISRKVKRILSSNLHWYLRYLWLRVPEVIRGWDLGVMTMTKGEGSRFTLAPEVGYGPGGFPAWGIPPNATLVFDIEILRINGA